MENTSTGADVQQNTGVERKGWVIALMLAFFLGAIGAHRFYLGKNVSGIIMLVLTVASPVTLFISLFITGVWALVDFILILIGSMKDSNGNELQK